MNVTLLGAQGNMGKRYQSILKRLGVGYVAADIGCNMAKLIAPLEHGDKIIIATPTDTHPAVIYDVCYYKQKEPQIDVLCEKPITKDLDTLNDLYDACRKCFVNLYSVNQYQYIPEASHPNAKGDSYYDYFNSGRDGVKWDCFQVYALAHGKVTVSNESPIWSCAINGMELTHADMDFAYISMIKDFLGEKQRLWGKEKVVETTKRILSA
jgi:hypothetical protein